MRCGVMQLPDKDSGFDGGREHEQQLQVRCSAFYCIGEAVLGGESEGAPHLL